MRLVSSVVKALLVVLVPVAAVAQDKSPGAGTGTVTGRVMFADSNGPARFAKVLLKSVTVQPSDDIFSALLKDDDEGPAKKGSKAAAAKPKLTPEEEAQKKQQMAAASRVFAQMADMLQATTIGADGVYTFAGIKPGTYYVHASAKGYIDPLEQFSDAEMQSADPAVRKRIAAVATVVTVTGQQSVRADLRLERGASISGRVLYDDGTPAAGWKVRPVVNAVSGGADMGTFAEMGLDASDMDLSHIDEVAQTDDLGVYRIAGLPTGDYVLQARLSMAALGRESQGGAAPPGFAGMMGLKLTVFSGNTVRQSEAKPISVRAGENRADVDITMPLHSMHALGGTVRAKADGHPVNGGLVTLTGQTPDGSADPSLIMVSQIRRDGTFRFDYVPGQAAYGLKVTNATDSTVTGTREVLGRSVPDQKVTQKYAAATSSARLGDGDVTDLKIDVVEGPK